MKREITYTWRARELMARNGINSAQALTDQLRERGITLSRSQVWRLVAQDTERISFAVLGALCDVLGVEPNELIVFAASDARTLRQRAIGNAAPLPDLRDYRPVRARIVTDDTDD